MIDHNFVKVIKNCELESERAVVQETWRALMREFRKMGKEDLATILLPMMQYLLQVEWKKMLTLALPKYSYNVCHRVLESALSVLDLVRTE